MDILGIDEVFGVDILGMEEARGEGVPPAFVTWWSTTIAFTAMGCNTATEGDSINSNETVANYGFGILGGG